MNPFSKGFTENKFYNYLTRNKKSRIFKELTFYLLFNPIIETSILLRDFIMMFILGAIIVIASSIMPYYLHGGSLMVLWQPGEYVTIVGAAIGATMISNPIDNIKKALSYLKYLFKAKPYDKDNYLELLTFLFSIFKLAKTKGMLEVEKHLESPSESELFKLAPTILKDEKILVFIVDYLRLLTIGFDNSYEFEDLIDKELEEFDHYVKKAGHLWSHFGDALPALGIVAAVLGVITTMASINEPPAVLGGLIGAALVGTFLGILLSYGIFSPIGTYLTSFGDAQFKYAECIKMGLISFLKGHSPMVTVEIVRKIIPYNIRPNFKETEDKISISK